MLCLKLCHVIGLQRRKERKVNSLSRVWLFATPMDCSLPGYSVQGIFQARVLEWVAISFSRESSWLRDWTWVFALQADALPSKPPGRTRSQFSKQSSQASLVAQMVNNLPATRRPGLDPWVRKIPWRREWQPNPVFLHGQFHGQSSLAGYCPWGHKELGTTELVTPSSTSSQKSFSC